MQFIPNGPDIPDSLLQAHEEGRVVFFCGAGISFHAGLKDFEWLVNKIYELNGASPFDNDIEKEAFKRKHFDATLDLLEQRLPSHRIGVRRALQKALKPNIRLEGATDTQAALLRLARSREGALRLVTTNFDRVFHAAAKRIHQPFQVYAAPMLPIPKNSRWDGLVYLHGLLPTKVDDTALNRLVLTSGDFGLAYLTERWAARFVSELFRNYVVCFVGYSINDPVLRYMMDALAADRRQGEVTPQAWAFGDCELGQEHEKRNEWKAKGVTPILYNKPTGNQNHAALHKTLYAWAETYRDGVQGKEAIVVKHALADPQDSTCQDDFVGRVLWALSHPSGLPAKRFAECNPVPSLKWLLEAFSDERYRHSDLERFDVPAREKIDQNLSFSLIRRPTPYDRASQMCLVSMGSSESQWDDVMFHLARWLLRHLDDPRLIIWIAERGGQLHSNWSGLIERELDRFALLEKEGKTSELDEIRLYAPKAIPTPLMHTLWRLLINGQVKSSWHDSDFYRWKGRLQREGLTTTLRMKLRELLAPKIILRNPFLWADDSISVSEPTTIKQLVDWELTLAADHIHYALRNFVDDHWTEALPLLIEDFQQLLRDALDLLCDLGEANVRSDRSYLDLPSITHHAQNQGFRDWVSLIELLRDAWLALHVKDSVRATRIAQSWFDFPYPTFKRLALFAASKNNCIRSEQWVDWLLSDGDWWLWAKDTQREVCRLLVLQGKNLSKVAQKRLESAILKGSPRKLLEGKAEPDWWPQHVLFSIWLHLEKLSASGLTLGKHARARLTEISDSRPKWKLAINESDEFAIWIGGSDDPDDETRHVDIAPRKRHALVRWLLKSPQQQSTFYEDTWRYVCRKHLLNSLCALNDLAHRDEWPKVRWRTALQTWSEKGMVLRSWQYAAPLVQEMPNEVLQEIVHSVSWWMESASKSINHHEGIMLALCRRVLALPLEIGQGTGMIHDGVETYDPVGSAINHPIGHVAQVMINLCFKHKPNDNDLLPADLKDVLETLCDVKIDRFRHGRVLLCSRVIAFFRVDRSWTEQHLLPLFSWTNSIEARAVWEGFLRSPRLYQPLLTAFKPQFLDTANHYADLGDHRQQFATFLTYAALGPTDDYTADEFRTAIRVLPPEGQERAAQAICQALEGAADQGEDYWKNRVQPFWKKVWPQSSELATPQIGKFLARMSIAARNEFPSALAEVHGWLKPIEHPDTIVALLYESGLCKQFPQEALTLLYAVIDVPHSVPLMLGECLNQIALCAPKLTHDFRYFKLREYCRTSQ